MGRRPITCECDPERVAQVMRILLDNALVHTPTGTGIVVSAARANGEVRLEVSDSGLGIKRQTMPHIFEPFFTSADGARGAGLGLAIARELAERMDGKPDGALRAGRHHLPPHAPGMIARRLAALGVLAALAAAAAGCGLLGGEDDGGAATARHRTTTTTRVEVVERQGDGAGGFDARRLYEDLAPGVVTVVSFFGAGGGVVPGEQGSGVGSGFVVSGRRRDRHQRRTSSPRARCPTCRRPRRSTWSSPTATRSRPRCRATTRTPTSRSSRWTRRA